MFDTKWDLRFLELAKQISTFSKDPSTKTGSVIVRPDKTLISMGFNGFPRNILDSEERLHDRLLKYELIIHAEMNAILNAHNLDSLEGATLYNWPMMCCMRCMVHVAQTGIKRIVAPKIDKDNTFFSRWISQIQLSESLCQEAGITVLYYPNLFGSHNA